MEDDRLDRRLIWRRLRRADPRLAPVFAASLNEARRRLAAGGLAGVILDNALPDGHGADLAAEIAADARLAALPVFLLSGWPSPFMEAKAARAGVRAVLAKDRFDDAAAARMAAVFAGALSRPAARSRG